MRGTSDQFVAGSSGVCWASRRCMASHPRARHRVRITGLAVCCSESAGWRTQADVDWRGSDRGTNYRYPVPLETLEPRTAVTKPEVEHGDLAVMALPKPCVAGSIPAGGTNVTASITDLQSLSAAHVPLACPISYLLTAPFVRAAGEVGVAFVDGPGAVPGRHVGVGTPEPASRDHETPRVANVVRGGGSIPSGRR